jgi:hypothetical protein
MVIPQLSVPLLLTDYFADRTQDPLETPKFYKNLLFTDFAQGTLVFRKNIVEDRLLLF